MIRAPKHHLGGHKFKVDREVETAGRGQFKCDDTRAETRFRLSAKRTSPIKWAGSVSSVDYWQPRCAHQQW